MTDEINDKINAKLNDDERKARFAALVADSPYEGHGAVSNTIRDLIDEAYRRRDLEDADLDDLRDDEEDDGGYNPHDYGPEFVLPRETLKTVLREEPQPAIDPEHVGPDELPKSVARKAEILVAVARHEKHHEWTPRGVDQLINLARDTYGPVDSRTLKQRAKGAYDLIDGEIGRPSNVTMEDEFERALEPFGEHVADVIEADAAPEAYRSLREEAGERYRWTQLVGDEDAAEKLAELMDDLEDAARAADDRGE